jgi:hypothetical protein
MRQVSTQPHPCAGHPIIFDNDHVADPKWRECIARELPAPAKSEGFALPKPKGAAA